MTRAIDDLRQDLASGEWDKRYGHLRTTTEYDAGLRLLTAELWPNSSASRAMDGFRVRNRTAR